MQSQKEHWEKVYFSKQPDEVSWTQEVPKLSLDFIHSFNLSKAARIVDIGGGDSKLVDHLLLEGYTNITLLDISANAIERAKKRLGRKSQEVKWIVSDIADFKPNSEFDLWHDRATFHFLTSHDQVTRYVDIVKRFVAGYLVISTFSPSGPKKCSGLDIQQYSEETLTDQFKDEFEKIRCMTEDHVTPFNTIQNFLFCGFNRRISQ